MPRKSEFRIYPDIRDNLRRLGWNTNSPASDPLGDVYDQHECADDRGLAKSLGRLAPEHVVVVSKSKRIYWAIEAKSSMAEIDVAVAEAKAYAERISAGAKQRGAFYTGIAGGPEEGYLRRTYYIDENGNHAVVNHDGVAITSLLPRESLEQILKADTASLHDLPLDEGELLRIAAIINETLHAASINKDDRAAVVASILLTMAMDDIPDAKLPPAAYAGRVNLIAQAQLAKVHKDHFADHIALRLPKGENAQTKFVGAMIKTADALRHINIAAAMRSGTDVLGEFYEAFLKYGNGAKDLGIVLTPRHITRWAAEMLPMSAADVVYDPTCGTGGFLVSAYDEVKSIAGLSPEFEIFRSARIFGIEQQPKIAALAVVNMIFRGDGSTNILDDDTLRQFLTYSSRDGERTARFKPVSARNGPPGVTRVLMNPPFALDAQAEREYEFVEHALRQMEDGGLLFAVLPSPVMVKDGGPALWRRERLLPNHTVRGVVAFPEDLFYPGVSVDTVGVFIEKGRPHRPDDEVIWARVAVDGHAKVKGTRVRSDRVPDQLADISKAVAATLRDRRYVVASIPGLLKKCALDPSDQLCELLPQVYLDEPEPDAQKVERDVQHAVREYLAFLIRTADSSTVSVALSAAKPKARPRRTPHAFRLFRLDELFGGVNVGIFKGSIHALNVEYPGSTPVVSSRTDDNGILGYYDLDARWPRFDNVITVASNGTPLTSYFHPYEIVPKDDVFVCRPPEDFPLETTVYVITAINAVTWRFSYYRKAYLNKLDKIGIFMPVTKSGDIDHPWLRAVAESCDGWEQLRNAMPTWRPEPFVSLGKRSSALVIVRPPDEG